MTESSLSLTFVWLVAGLPDFPFLPLPQHSVSGNNDNYESAVWVKLKFTCFWDIPTIPSLMCSHNGIVGVGCPRRVFNCSQSELTFMIFFYFPALIYEVDRAWHKNMTLMSFLFYLSARTFELRFECLAMDCRWLEEIYDIGFIDTQFNCATFWESIEQSLPFPHSYPGDRYAEGPYHKIDTLFAH